MSDDNLALLALPRARSLNAHTDESKRLRRLADFVLWTHSLPETENRQSNSSNKNKNKNNKIKSNSEGNEKDKSKKSNIDERTIDKSNTGKRDNSIEIGANTDQTDTLTRDEKQISTELLSSVVHTLALHRLLNDRCENTLKFCRNAFGNILDSDQEKNSEEALFEATTLLTQLSSSALGPAIQPLPTPRETDKKLLRSIWSQLQLLQSAANSESLLSHATDLGYAYQFFNAPIRKKAQSSIQKANKSLNIDDLIAFTQLYTPGWIVEFLLQNAVTAQLATAPQRAKSWLLKENAGQKDPGQITLLDPACGSGHFLVYAFELLFNCHKHRGIDDDSAAAEALRQIHGTDIDPVALHVASLSLLISYIERCGQAPSGAWAPLSLVANETLGSLSRAFVEPHPLSKRYNAVVTNPPYIGRKLISREHKAALKAQYQNCSNDLSTPFLARALELLEPGGRLGFITQSSILSLPSYEGIRKRLLAESFLHSVVELGSGAFPLQGGEKVNSVLLVAEASLKDLTHSNTTFIDLTDCEDKPESLKEILSAPDKSNQSNYFIRRQSNFENFPFFSFQYSCPPELIKVISKLPDLSTVADVRQGLATTDNERFLKYWWHVPPEAIGVSWFPYVKGAGGDRWSSPILHLVNFQDNGREIKEAVQLKYPYLKGKTAWVVKNEQFYFRQGLCFSFVSTDEFAVRAMPANCIFDVAASAIFATPEHSNFLLAYLNSSLMRAICRVVNPTINMQVGDVKRLPLFSYSDPIKEQLAELAVACADLKKQLDEFISPTMPYVRAKELGKCHSSSGHHAHPAEEKMEDRVSILNINERLIRAESEIDDLVLHECSEINALNSADKNSIHNWVSSKTSPRANHPAAIISREGQIDTLTDLRRQWTNASSIEELDSINVSIRRLAKQSRAKEKLAAQPTHSS